MEPKIELIPVKSWKAATAAYCEDGCGLLWTSADWFPPRGGSQVKWMHEGGTGHTVKPYALDFIPASA